MTQTRGFFSVIQFCPDLDRGEYANVGIVLAVPQSGVLEVRMSEDNEGPKFFVGLLIGTVIVIGSPSSETTRGETLPRTPSISTVPDGETAVKPCSKSPSCSISISNSPISPFSKPWWCDASARFLV